MFLGVRGLVFPDRGVARRGGKRLYEGVDKGGTSVRVRCSVARCTSVRPRNDEVAKRKY